MIHSTRSILNRALPIGLDLGSASVKACLKLQRTPGESLASVLERVHDAMPRQGLCGTRVVVAPPPDAPIVGMFDVPPSDSGAPLDTIVRGELARSHKKSTESFELAWWELPASERHTGATTVIAVGLPHEQANPMLDAIEGAGFVVEAVDIPASALARGCGAALLPEPSINAVLDLGWLRPQLVLLRGRRIVYQRELPEFGLEKLIAQLRARLRLDDEAAIVLGTRLLMDEAPAIDPELQAQLELVQAEYTNRLARELELSLRYALHRYPGGTSTRLVLAGGGAGLSGLSGELRAALGCEVLAPRLQELAPVSVAFSQATGIGDFALALGLATHREGREAVLQPGRQRQEAVA
jgi:Tfp pilus assembly PilM family ATPase